jgi:hypothetical protein
MRIPSLFLPRRDRLATLAGVVLVASAALALAAPAGAQIGPGGEPRQRPYHGLFGGGPPIDPNRTRTDLTLTGAIFGGHDDDVVAAAPGIGAPGAGGSDPTNNVQGSLALAYRRGNQRRSLTVDGNGFAIKYGDDAVGTLKGGSLGFAGLTGVGRSGQFTVQQRVSYFPVFSFASIAEIETPVVDVDTLPTAGPAVGIFERASWASQTSLGYSHALRRRTTLDLAYGFSARKYESSPNPVDALGDGTAHTASIDIRQEITRSWNLTGQYDLSHQRPTELDGVRPVTDHSVRLGLGWTKRVSRTRTLHASASAGAVHVRSTLGVAPARTPFDYTAPSAEAQVGMDFGRNWNLSSNYRRSVTVTPELTSETFLTDAVVVSGRGLIGPRLELLMTASRDASDASNTGSSATFASTSAGIEAQLAFTRRIAATLAYTYFKYAFESVADLPVGFTPDSERNAIRVGVTIRLPLIGRYEGERGTAPAGRP